MNKISIDTVPILLLTPYIYFVTYLTEVGFCNYFAIPEALIAINSSNLSSIAAILCLIYIAIYLIDFSTVKVLSYVLKINRNRIPGINKLANTSIPTGMIIIIIGLFVVDKSDRSTLYLFIAMAVILSVAAMVVVVKKKNIEEGALSLQGASDSPTLPENRSLIHSVFDRKVTVIIIVTILITLPLSTKGGAYNAKKQTTFYRINNRDDLLGIVIYGDKIICKPYASDALGAQTIIFTIRDSTKIEILKSLNPKLAYRN